MSMKTLVLSVLTVGCTVLSAQSPGTTDFKKILAPTGRLRVAVYPGSPTSMIEDSATGGRKGVTFEVGEALAKRLGVPFEPVVVQRAAEAADALKSGAADFTITNATPARAKDLIFPATVLDLELGYLALTGSPVSSIDNVDRSGIRIGVAEGSTSQATLTREFKNATVVPAPSLAAAADMLSKKTIDAFATNKAILFEMSDTVKGSRVLDGRWGFEHLAMAIPKGREAASGYVAKFADDVRAQGFIKRAVERAGLRGAVEAAAK
jgi:polar amino acid transport system substrate-binding protein